jgi:DNA-binding transcriptional MerR regulator
MNEHEELAAVDVPDKLFFRIGEAAELVGVEAHVLRYWEGEFKMNTKRSTSGQRMYRRKDIARFLRIRRLLHEEGFTIAGARKALSGDAGPIVAAIDESGIRDARQRIEAVRGRIAEHRERYARALSLDTDA